MRNLTNLLCCTKPPPPSYPSHSTSTSTPPTYYDYLMIWTAMLLSFFGFQRSSELVLLQVEDTTPQYNAFGITILASKTDHSRRALPSMLQSLKIPLHAQYKHYSNIPFTDHWLLGHCFCFSNGSLLPKMALTNWPRPSRNKWALHQTTILHAQLLDRGCINHSCTPPDQLQAFPVTRTPMLGKCMTLWREPEGIHIQNTETLHVHDRHQNVTVTETLGPKNMTQKVQTHAQHRNYESGYSSVKQSSRYVTHSIPYG